MTNYIYAVQNTATGKHWLLACRNDYQRDFERIKERDKNGTLFESARTRGKDIFRGNPDELKAVVIEEVSDANTLQERRRYWAGKFREVVEIVRAGIRKDSNPRRPSDAIAQPVHGAGHDPISVFLEAAKDLRYSGALDTRELKLNADLEFVIINGMDFDAGRRLFENLAIRRNWYVEELWDSLCELRESRLRDIAEREPHLGSLRDPHTSTTEDTEGSEPGFSDNLDDDTQGVSQVTTLSPVTEPRRPSWWPEEYWNTDREVDDGMIEGWRLDYACEHNVPISMVRY